MDELNAKVLAHLYPEIAARADANWRDRKSAETRIALMEATVDCLNRVGYAQTTTREIANVLGIAHASIRHHYTKKLNLIAGAIDYAFYRRLEGYKDELERLSPEERADPLGGTALFWSTLETKEYAACLELEIAARTDHELAEIYVPRAQAFDRIWRDEMVRLHPGWERESRTYELVVDLGWALMEGAMLKRYVWDSPSRRERLHELFVTVVRKLRSGDISIE